MDRSLTSYVAPRWTETAERFAWDSEAYHFAMGMVDLRGVRWWKQAARIAREQGRAETDSGVAWCLQQVAELTESMGKHLNRAWEMRRAREARQLPVVCSFAKIA